MSVTLLQRAIPAGAREVYSHVRPLLHNGLALGIQAQFLVACDDKLHKRIELRRARIKIYTIENPAIIAGFEVNLHKNRHAR